MDIPGNNRFKGFAVVGENEAQLDPYPYIYVNADGSARELHRDERQYLETRFHPADGARPYIKENYAQKDGWSEIKGFLKRSKLPREVSIDAAPAENPSRPLTKEQQIQFLRDQGFEVVENSNGSITARRPRASDTSN